jgi:hypothetical protein
MGWVYFIIGRHTDLGAGFLLTHFLALKCGVNAGFDASLARKYQVTNCEAGT